MTDLSTSKALNDNTTGKTEIAGMDIDGVD